MHMHTQTMKRLELLSRPFKQITLAVVMGCFINHANAERILYESFETPVVLDGSGTDPDGWTEGGGHPSYRCVANESGKNWSTPYGEQGMSTYSNGVGLKDLGYMPDESGVYILKFNMTSSASKAEYRAEILTQEEQFGALQPEVIVASKAGDSDTSKNMSFSDQITWRYDYNPAVHYPPKKLLIKLMQDPNRADWRNTPIWDNVSVDWIPDVDSTGPTVLDIADDNQGGTVVATNSLVTYTVTFNEPMKASTVNPSDFGNAGSADILSPVVEPVSPQVFLVKITPTSEGSLYLKINEDAILEDAVVPVANAMDTSLPIFDPVDLVILTVEADTPILKPVDIVDNKGGNSVTPNTLVTYTLSFNKDMNASTVSAADFGNAGTAPFTIGAVTETTSTSGVFSVQVTPTGSGTLQLRVNEAVLIEAADGGELNTSLEIADDTTITVDGTPPTLTNITDDAGGSPVTVGAPVTYDVFFSEDMDASTVNASDFGNALTTGNAPFTINSVEEASPGVFRIIITPSGAGSIRLRVNSGATLKDAPGNFLNTTAAILDDASITVTAAPSNPYAVWSGGAAFNADANGDGVDNGMAWLLGAGTPTANAIARQPAVSQSSGDLVLNFTCLKIAKRGTAVLKLQYSKDLGFNDAWASHEVVVPDTAGPIGSVIFTIPSVNADPNLVNLQATIPASAAIPGKTLFARLQATP
jgi:hypothetical protein